MPPRGRRTAQDGRECAEGGPDTPWMTTGLAAAYCRIHPNTLSRWLATGLPHVRLVGVIRIHRDDLDVYATEADEARKRAAAAMDRAMEPRKIVEN